MLELVSFGARVAGASLVITGEGSLDKQTLRGKAPAGVALAARLASPGTPVVAVAGACTLDEASLARAGIAAAYALAAVEPDLASSMTNAGSLLEKLAAQVAADWLAPAPGRAIRPDEPFGEHSQGESTTGVRSVRPAPSAAGPRGAARWPGRGW